MAAKLAACLTALDDTSFASLPGRYTSGLSVLFDFAGKQVTPSGAEIAPASDHASRNFVIASGVKQSSLGATGLLRRKGSSQ
jgi:hypothetical protein